MSTLHDLRETLERHADGIDDTGRHDRAVAVRGRVRVARRRRTAAGAVAAALVVTGGVAGVASLRGPASVDPADSTVVGVTVPERVDIHGFPYELTGGDPIEGEADRLRVPLSGTRAVSLVADGLGSGSVTLYADGEPIVREFGSDAVSLPVPIPGSGAQSTLRVELEGAPPGATVGVALYAATDELAVGVDDGSVVFRRSVGDAQLLTAAFAEPDEAMASVSFTAPLADVTLTAHCRTEERGLWLRVELDGELTQHGQCGDGADRDAGGSSWSGGGEASRPHTVTAYVTRGRAGAVVEDAEVGLGVAAYTRGRTVRLGGADVASVVEHAGRTWRLDTDASRAAGASGRVRAAETDLLLGFVAEGRIVRATWRGSLTRGGTTYVDASTGPATMVDGLLLRGDSYEVELESDGPLVDGTLLVYRPV